MFQKNKKTILIFIAVLFLAVFVFAIIFIFQKPETVKATDYSETFYSSASDGYIYKTGTNYTTVHNSATGTVSAAISVFRIGQKGTSYGVYRAFVFFDTSSIPSNATIISATLSLYGSTDFSDTDFDIIIRNGQPTYPHYPLATGDYYYANCSGDGGTFNTSSFSVSGYNDISLNADGLSWIQKGDGALTKLALTSSRDVSATTPTGNEMVDVKSYESAGYQPKLVVNYTVSSGNSTHVTSGVKIGNGIIVK